MNKLNPLVFILVFVLAAIFSSHIIAQEIPVIDWAKMGQDKVPEKTEQWEPVPPKVTPGLHNVPPSDAIVLFNGKDLDDWHNPKYDYGARMDQIEAIVKLRASDQQEYTPATWVVKEGTMIVEPGSGAIETKEAFGSCQLHIEWLAPVDPGKEGQGYSNSGVFLMGLYEIQVLNSYENSTYPNGQAGSVYKQKIPQVNASRPPGEWQSYDIIFNAPEFSESGALKKPAFLTVLHNGVLIQNHVELEGPCVFIDRSYYTPHAAKLPLLLQDHGNKVRFRNIWIREL